MYLFIIIILKSVSLHSPGWPLICDNPPFSAFWVPRLQVFIITMALQNDTFMKIQLAHHRTHSFGLITRLFKHLQWPPCIHCPTYAITSFPFLLPLVPGSHPPSFYVYWLVCSGRVVWTNNVNSAILCLPSFLWAVQGTHCIAYVDFIAFISESAVERGDRYPPITRFSVWIALTLGYHYQYCHDFHAQVLVQTHSVHSFECVSRSGRNCWVIATILGVLFP